MPIKNILLFIGVVYLFQNCTNHQPTTSVASGSDSTILTHVDSSVLKQPEQPTITPIFNHSTTQQKPSAHIEQAEETGVEEEKISPIDTKLLYQHFSIIIKAFKGFYIGTMENDGVNGRFYWQVPDTIEAYATYDGAEALNPFDWEDTYENNSAVMFKVKKDTVSISEDLDERINNTLIQIVPKHKQDRFTMSFCYLTNLNELMPPEVRALRSERASKKWEETALYYKEKTKWMSIKDSAHFFFRAMPHTSDMEQVTVVNGEVVPVKGRNTPAQINWEEELYNEEIKRIKHKYHLRDTFVDMSGESSIVATLAKGNRLFTYDYGAFFFRVQRYRHNKLVETIYIRVGIMYGC